MWDCNSSVQAIQMKLDLKKTSLRFRYKALEMKVKGNGEMTCKKNYFPL